MCGSSAANFHLCPLVTFYYQSTAWSRNEKVSIIVANSLWAFPTKPTSYLVPLPWPKLSGSQTAVMKGRGCSVLACLALAVLPQTLAQYSRCPEPYGLQTYPHEGYCDKFYKCANG